MRLAIWGDGKLLYSRYNYQKTDAPETDRAEYDGHQISFRSRWRTGEAYNNGFLGLNEAKLLEKRHGGDFWPVLVDELGDLTLIDSEEYGDYSEGVACTPMFTEMSMKTGTISRRKTWEQGLSTRLGGKYTSV